MNEKFYSAFCALLYKNFGDKWDFKFDEENFEDGDAFTLNLTVWGQQTSSNKHPLIMGKATTVKRGKANGSKKL